MKVCPKCGSTNIMSIAGGAVGIWKCKECRFSGTIFPELEKLEEKK